MKMNKIIPILAVVALLVIGFLTMGDQNGTEQAPQDNGVVRTEPKEIVRLAYVNWAEGVAMTNLVRAILEDKMNYDVEMTMADPGIVFTSVANADSDVFLDAWLPVTHESYMDRYGEQVDDLGFNFEGARIGLVVPEYVEIDSIEEMNDYTDEFDSQIIGIDAGAGIMNATERAIDNYDLDYQLISGSGPAMTASLQDSIDQEAWTVVTGWEPHWKFARWDLKFLDDPDQIYGEIENIHTITRQGFVNDMPEVAEFLENFYMDSEELGDLMGAIADSDDDPFPTARRWMEDNEDLVNEWLPNN